MMRRKAMLWMLGSWLMAASSPASSQPPVVISKRTPQLRVKSVELLDDGKTAIQAWVSGVLIVRAKVRFGWFPDFTSFDNETPMLEIELSPSERTKLPYLADWTPGYFSSFSLENANPIAKQLFDRDALQSVREKRMLAIEQDATLALSQLEFGSSCGMHYRAVARVVRTVVVRRPRLLAEGLAPHC